MKQSKNLIAWTLCAILWPCLSFTQSSTAPLFTTSDTSKITKADTCISKARHRSLLEAGAVLPGLIQENETLKKELSAVELERDLLKEKNKYIDNELGKCQKHTQKDKIKKIGLGVGIGLVGTTAFIGGYFLGRGTK